MQITRTHLPARTLVQRVRSGEESFKDCWMAFFPPLHQQGLMGPDAQVLADFDYDTDHPSGGEGAITRYAASVSVAGAAAVEAPLAARTLPAGDYLVTIYKGPMDGLGAAWGAFLAALTERGDALSPSDWTETYLDDPTTTAPEDCRTELAARLR